MCKMNTCWCERQMAKWEIEFSSTDLCIQKKVPTIASPIPTRDHLPDSANYLRVFTQCFKLECHPTLLALSHSFLSLLYTYCDPRSRPCYYLFCRLLQSGNITSCTNSFEKSSLVPSLPSPTSSLEN